MPYIELVQQRTIVTAGAWCFHMNQVINVALSLSTVDNKYRKAKE